MPFLDDLVKIRPLGAVARKPAVTQYNRLEPSPRTENFERSLRAEVRDPLWMLCRQWQLGELQGEDAATAVSAKVLGHHHTPGRIALGTDKKAYKLPTDKPLEALVEAEQLVPDLYLQTQMSRYFLKLLRAHNISQYYAQHRSKYPLVLDTAIPEGDPDAHYLVAAAKEEIFNAHGLYRILLQANTPYKDWLLEETSIDASAKAVLVKEVAPRFVAWFERTYVHPLAVADGTGGYAGNLAWQPSRLEYRFALDTKSTGDITEDLLAEQYVNGHLDWYAFDQNSRFPAADAKENTQTYLPAALTYKGMPHQRFWQMEDRKVDFGKIDPGPTGTLSVMLAQYALTYSNDWFILPYKMNVNEVCQIKGILVKDVFGEYTLVQPVVNNNDAFGLCYLKMQGTSGNPFRTFYLPPSVGKMLEGEPLERLHFQRDEMANLVWAIESVVPSQAGGGISARALLKTNAPISEGQTPDETTMARYVLGTTVPENWIPFIPVQKPQVTGAAICFQRAQMPQAPGAKGVILREKAAPYLIEEEEISRAGVIVERSFQRARWQNGRICLWVGRKKTAGRGEASSGLGFDRIV